MQQPIRIYTPYMDLLHETDNYLSLQFTPKFYEVGEFEVHVNQYTEGAEYFQKNNLIMLDKQKDKVGIIRHREIALDETGKLSENWKITGVALKGVLSQRVTIPPSDTGYDRKSGDAETVMKHYVENHFINPNDTDRRIDHVEVAPNKNRGAHIEWESRFKNVDEEIIAISKQANLGWVMYADMVKKKWIFDVVEPRDVTQGNEAGLPPVFFSPDFQTIKTQQFVDSDVNLKNFGYVGGQGEGVDRLVEKIGASKGLERLEAFIDARDVGGSGEEDLTPEQIQQKLIERGQSKLDEMSTDFYLEAQILTPTINDNSGRFALKTPFEYEVDFRLGDTVQVFNKKWNITMDAPITAFKEIHEVGGFVLEATFGEAQPTLINKIKGKFDEISGIEQQELPVQIAVERMQDAKNYSDANLSAEEKARIAQAQDNLEESLNYADDQDVIYDNLAKEYAEDARIAAEAVAVAKANLAETNAKSYADGIVTDEEAARIAQAEADLAEAKAASALAKTQAKAYADGIVTTEEQARIDDVNQAVIDAALDAKTKADAAESAAKSYTNSQLTNYVGTTIYDSDLASIQAQIDNQITSHFKAYEPSLTNEPASLWTDNAEKDKHVGDLFYNSSTGYSYRFMLDNTVYKWTLVRDEGIAKALQDASQAQDTADGKRRVFVAQPTTPYDRGDLWVDETNGKPKVHSSLVDKTKSATFSQADWELIGDVTGENTADDTSNVGGRPSSDIEDVQGARAKADGAENSAKSHADSVALAEANLAETQAEAYADGIVTAEEQTRIDQDAAHLADAKGYTDEKVYRYPNNVYDSPDDASIYSPKPSVAVMQSTTWSGSGSPYGTLTTYWSTTNRANQYYVDNSGNSFSREVHPASYPTWSSWKETEDINGSQAKADTAEQSAKAYAVAEAVYDTKMQEIATDLGDKAGLTYVDGQLVSKANKADTYTITETDNKLLNYVGVTSYQTDQDGVVQTLDSHGTRLGQNETAIGLKASQTDLNTVKGTVSDNSGELTVQAGKIASKVDATYVSGAIADVGRWTGRYRVNTANPLQLTEKDGTPLSDAFTYEVVARVTGTGSETTAIVIFTSNGDGNGWSLTKIKELGTSSNHPEFFLNVDGLPSIRLYGHTSFYSVEVTHEKTRGRTNANAVANATLSDHSTSITQTAAKVETKAESSVVNALTGRVDTAEGNITTIAGKVELKANSSVTDDLGTRLNSAELTIDGLESEITLKADKVTLDAYVTINDLEVDGNLKFGGTLSGASGDFSGTVSSSVIETTKTVDGRVQNARFNGDEFRFVRFKDGVSNPNTATLDTTKVDNVSRIFYDGIAFASASESAGIGISGIQHSGMLNFYVDAMSVDAPNGTTFMNNVDMWSGLNVDGRITATGGIQVSGGVNTDSIYTEYDNAIAFEHSNGSNARFWPDGTFTTEANEGVLYSLTPDKLVNEVGIYSGPRSSGAELHMGTDGTGQYLRSIDVWNRTYGSAGSSVIVTDQGTFGRRTSASKYKLNIEPMDTDKRILKLQPKNWFDKSASETYAELLTKESNHYPDGTPKEPEIVDWFKQDIPPIEKTPGLIAEDLIAAGLSKYVQFSNGEPEGIDYDRLWIELIPEVQENKDEINILKQRLDKLEAK